MLSRSLFIAGTDTDVGKTCIAAGMAMLLQEKGVDVGVMKPFAAGKPQRYGYKSKDVQILSKAAGVNDPESLVNPQFFPIFASPYTAWKTLQIKPKVGTILSSFKRLARLHSMLLVEGMGGVMTPILRDYYVADLIHDMRIPAVIVTRTRVGTINHTVMTVKMCNKYKIPVRGIIINDLDTKGYKTAELTRDLAKLTDIPILGTIPFIADMNDSSMHKTFKKNLDLKPLFV